MYLHSENKTHGYLNFPTWVFSFSFSFKLQEAVRPDAHCHILGLIPLKILQPKLLLYLCALLWEGHKHLWTRCSREWRQEEYWMNFWAYFYSHYYSSMHMRFCQFSNSYVSISVPCFSRARVNVLGWLHAWIANTIFLSLAFGLY